MYPISRYLGWSEKILHNRDFSMGTFDQRCTKVPILVTKLPEKNQLISNDSNMNQAIELKFSGDVHQVSALN